MAKRNDKYLGGHHEWPLWFKGFLVFGVVLIAGVFFFYTQTLISQIKENSRQVMNTYARLWQLAASAPTSGAEIDVIFEEIIQKSDFPIVVTDAEGELLAWRGVGVDWDDTTYISREKLKKMAQKMDRHKQPIPIYFGTRQEIINYLHYGDPVLISQLRLMSFVELGLLTLFVLIAFITFRNIKMAEQRTIWVGMSKETAHQLGTPISSLLGWLELLKAKCETQAETPEEDSGLTIEQIAERVDVDLRRLGKIAHRFEQIGSVPELKSTDLNTVVSEAIAYFRQRLPHNGSGVVIKERLGSLAPARANAELISWVMENLLKNSLEAVDPRKGVIKVLTSLDKEKKTILIQVTDNGRGIPPRRQKKIFRPGYTTKKRGWGLGLSLAKRIIEEYHLGKISLKESVPNQRTTILVCVPTERKESSQKSV
ncbi:MAG: HAMP domain-containing sensor histidine kinase [Candidatus Zixiibacteriota bacterium]